VTYRKHLDVVGNHIGDVPVRQLRPEQVAAMISSLADSGSASRAVNIRNVLVQVLNEAVTLGLAVDNVAQKVKRPRVTRKSKRTLTPDEIGRLLENCGPRYVAAVALCFVQGWRISEALGLAWQDIDFDEGTIQLTRAATYLDGQGMVLGPPKTHRTAGRQLVGPTVLKLLQRRQALQTEDREKLGDTWPAVTYEDQTVDLVFTSSNGHPMLRQHVDRAVRKAATAANLDPSNIGTHTGRRSVVTSLYASGAFDLGDVARFVGHSDVATTKTYVQSEGDRPEAVSRRALELLDPSQDRSHVL
jgi:integrase